MNLVGTDGVYSLKGLTLFLLLEGYLIDQVKLDTNYYLRDELGKYEPGYLVDKDGYRYIYVENPQQEDLRKYYNLSN